MGHRLSAMETSPDITLSDGTIFASMGPPPFGDGNRSGILTIWCGTKLQWGHRLSAMETPRDHCRK